MIAFPDEPPTDPGELLPNDPSPQEIRRRAAMIRKGWNANQLKRRQVTAEQSWRPPTVLLADIVVNVSATQTN